MTMQNFSNNREQWLYPFKYLLEKGKYVSPKGKKILEVENFSIKLNPIWNLCKFKERKINIGYMIGEMCWYLNGDRDDDFIIYYSKFWEKVKNKEHPFFNSNYGYYVFKQGQLNRCKNILLEDKDTRQAVIIIAHNESIGNNDTPCTYSVSFRIRNDKLNMTVNMRSNDIWRGFCIDMFQFSIWQQILYNALSYHYKDLLLGSYTHNVDSFHVYENNFKNIENLVYSGHNGWDKSISNIPTLTKWDCSFGLENLLTFEKNIRTTGESDIDIKGLGFTPFAAKELVNFSLNKK